MIINWTRVSPTAREPIKYYNEDACWDLCSNGEHMVTKYATIPTGLSIDIPYGYCGMIMSRSGLAANYGLFVLNAPGIIDAGYSGEIKVVLGNMSDRAWEIEHGERVAQIMFVPLDTIHLEHKVNMTINSERGKLGFGSTGY